MYQLSSMSLRDQKNWILISLSWQCVRRNTTLTEEIIYFYYFCLASAMYCLIFSRSCSSNCLFWLQVKKTVLQAPSWGPVTNALHSNISTHKLQNRRLSRTALQVPDISLNFQSCDLQLKTLPIGILLNCLYRQLLYGFQKYYIRNFQHSFL